MRTKDGERIALRRPALLLVLGAVVVAADVADVVATEAVRVAQQERGTVALPRPLDERRRRVVDGADILAVDARDREAERRWTRDDVAGGRRREKRDLAVVLVLADEDEREDPQLREGHRFGEQALSERGLAVGAG